MRLSLALPGALALAFLIPTAARAQHSQTPVLTTATPPAVRDVEAERPDHRWSLELLGGLDLPTGDLGLLPLNSGPGLEFSAAYRFHEHLWVYAGWGWHRFTTDEAEADIDLEQSGYAFGGRFEHPFRDDGVAAFRIFAAGTWEHVELEDAEGQVRADSGHGLGFDVGAGVALPIGSDWRLLPGVRFRSLPVELSPEGGSKADLTYLAVEVGVAYRF